MNSTIVFGNEKLKSSLEKLKTSKTEDRRLYLSIIGSLKALEKDAFSGTQIKKELIPKEYIQKFGRLDNLWKYNLPSAWRLIYTIKKDEIHLLCIILEWMSHKDYEKRFGY